jgi:cytochrome c oxidase cbb3-type subunit 2
MLESKGSVLVVAGLFFFALAFVSNALVPALMYKDLPEKTAEQLVTANLRFQFEDLARRFPESFEKHVGKVPADGPEKEQWLNQRCADLLRIGRKVYTGEACWHCHSQFVRPVSGESRRWGPVSQSWEYQNELQRPVLFGTRRVGPDLSREGGRRSNDWQAVHLFKPTLLSDGSVMPEYPWFFEGSPDKPNLRGLGLLTYLQWLGSWLPTYPYYEEWTSAHLPEGVEPGAVDQGAIDAANQGVTGAGNSETPTPPDSEPAPQDKTEDPEPSSESKPTETGASESAPDSPSAEPKAESPVEPKPTAPDAEPANNPEPASTEPAPEGAPPEQMNEGDRPPEPDEPTVQHRAEGLFPGKAVA